MLVHGLVILFFVWSWVGDCILELTGFVSTLLSFELEFVGFGLVISVLFGLCDLCLVSWMCCF